MAKVTLEDGTEVEMLTPEEAKVQSDAVLEQYKKDNPIAPVVVAKTPEELAQEKIAQDAANEPMAKLGRQLEEVHAKLRDREIADYAKTYAGNDTKKQDEYKTKFGRLTGYAETPEGLAERASDAAKMIGIDPTTVDVGDVAGTGGGRNIDSAAAVRQSEADTVVQKALGISVEDVKKYGGITQ